jgi:hypothetical protein
MKLKNHIIAEAKYQRASLAVRSRHVGGRGRPQDDSTEREHNPFLVLYDVKQVQAAEVLQRRTAVSSKCFQLYYIFSYTIHA